MTNYFIIKFFVVSFGLIWGSFLNVLIYRLPREMVFKHTRSQCPHCDKVIFWYENIPVLSYLFLRGRCSGCGGKISIRYPLVEIVTGVLALFAFENLSFSTFHLIPGYCLNFSIMSVFLVASCIDLEHKILPDILNGYLAICFLILGIMQYDWLHWLLGGAVGFFFPYSVTWVFYKLRGQIGLGGGDIKLFGALGLILGPVGIIHNLFLSCFLGSIVGVSLIAFGKLEKSEGIPFGPYIILVAFFQIFLPDRYQYLIELLTL